MRTRGDFRLANEESRLVIMQTGARRSKARQMQQEGSIKFKPGLTTMAASALINF
jgi:hypothetical protein